MAQLQNLDVYVETNATLSLAARNASNNPQNLTGLSITWVAGYGPNTPDLNQAVITKTGTISSAADGTYTVSLIPSDTMYLPRGNYIHRAFTTSGAGAIATVTYGTLRLRSVVEPIS